ncbi:MAG: hypothetical protein JXB85_01055 [Anaerolineales bacterium]|nr:hypothetical protein [Anaerolineales bacterium]
MPSERENEILQFLNDVTDPLLLMEKLLQEADVRISFEQAERILKVRGQLSGKEFLSLQQFKDHCGLPDDHVEDLERLLVPDPYTPMKNWPVLLFPVRLETRFIKNDLCIRIYPDKVSIETHEQKLTEREFEMGMYYREIHETGSKEAKHEAWRRLAKLFGPQRAAWVRRVALDLPRGAEPVLKGKSWTKAPRLRSFPDRFAIYLYRDANLVRKQACENRIPRTLPIFSSPEVSLPSLFAESSDWVVDFDKAVEYGMALRIPFTDDEMVVNRKLGFSRVIAVGIRAVEPETGLQELEGLIDNHHYTSGGLAFLEPGTPTNNTQEAKAGSPTSDPLLEASYRTEVKGPVLWDSPPQLPETNAQRLGFALGLGMQPEALRYIDGAGDKKDSYSKDMRAALWPATGGYFLQTMLPGLIAPPRLEELAGHFISHVDAGGPLPTIRVGDQPYGILPASTIFSREKTAAVLLEGLDPGGERFPVDRSLDDQLAFLLRRFALKWLDYARNPELVPRINTTDDPDKELLQVLAMQPVSISYQARPFVNEGFLSFLLIALRKYVFGSFTLFGSEVPSPLFWVQQWAEIYNEKRRETAAVLQGLSGHAGERFLDMPLLRVIGWWEGVSRPLPYTVGADPGDEPRAYLRSLCDQLPTTSGTLLFNLLRRSLKSKSSAESVRAAICRLANSDFTSAVLEFFNRVTSPEQITGWVEDDPEFPRASSGAYGIGETVAKRILETRAALPAERFTNLQQIDEIAGIGEDKLQDIFYSMTAEEQYPDYDRLMRETLDLCTHRLDAWITSIASKRLAAMRESKPTGIYLGAYGWVEDLIPSGAKNSAGFIHAPSAAQAATAAVLYNAYLTHDDPEDATEDTGVLSPNPFRLDLNSARVQNGLNLLDGIRQGQTLGALLGYQFERALFDAPDMNLAEYVDDFRYRFPMVANKETKPVGDESIEALAARNVVDGLALARAWRDDAHGDIGFLVEKLKGIAASEKGTFKSILTDLLESLDCVSDLLVHESVYQAVQGNYDRGGAALEAAAGSLTPPEIRSIATPVSGRTFSQRVCLLFNEPPAGPSSDPSPRELAEPRIAAWFARILGNMDSIRCAISFKPAVDSEQASCTICLSELGMTPIDFLYLSAVLPEGGETELDRRIKFHARNNYNLSYTEPIAIDYTADEGASSIADALEVGRHALHVLNAAGYLKPEALARPSVEEASSFADADIEELETRVKDTMVLVDKAVSDLQSFVLTNSTVVDDTFRLGLLASIKNAARFSVPAAVPAGGSGEPAEELEKRRWAVCAELEKRQKTCIGILDAYREIGSVSSSNEEDTDEFVTKKINSYKAVSLLIEATQALMGKSFIILPAFTVNPGSEFHDALVRGTLLPDDETMRLWIQQAASTHEPLRDVDTFMMMAETWTQAVRDGGDPEFSFHVAQLPAEAGASWLGVEHDFDATTMEYQGETLSLVTGWSRPPETGEGAKELRIAGLLFDQWEEFLPSDKVHTSVAIQYNSPNTQAPQSLLLAVPESSGSEPWSEDDLAAIVSDTLDLAKIRTVDLDALRDLPGGDHPGPDLGMILPAVLLPVDPDHPEWERDTAFGTFQNWIDALTGKVTCMDFSEFDPLENPWLLLPIGINNFTIDAVDGETTSIPFGFIEDGKVGMLYTRSKSLTVELPHETELVRLRMGWTPEVDPRKCIQAFDAAGVPLKTGITADHPEEIALVLDHVRGEIEKLVIRKVSVYGVGIKKLKISAVAQDEDIGTKRIMAIEQICVRDGEEVAP